MISSDGTKYLIRLARDALLGALSVATLALRNLVFRNACGTLLSATFLHMLKCFKSATKRLFQTSFHLVEPACYFPVVCENCQIISVRRRLRLYYLGLEFFLPMLESVMIFRCMVGQM
jgi:hypothetical protein